MTVYLDLADYLLIAEGVLGMPAGLGAVASHRERCRGGHAEHVPARELSSVLDGTR